MALYRTKDGHKTCAHCLRTFPRTTEYWHRNRSQFGSLHNYCKECRCALGREDRARRRGIAPPPPRPKRRFVFKNYHRDVRMELLIAYSQDPPCCACCGEATYEFLSIDHVNGDGYKTGRSRQDEWRRLRREGYPDKERYQVLCHNCNHSLGTYGYCPHRPDVSRPVYGPSRRAQRRMPAHADGVASYGGREEEAS